MAANVQRRAEIADAVQCILPEIENGASLRAAAEGKGVKPEVALLYILRHDDLAARYVSGFEAAAERYDAEATTIEERLASGTVERSEAPALRLRHKRLTALASARARSATSAITTAMKHREARLEREADRKRREALRAADREAQRQRDEERYARREAERKQREQDEADARAAVQCLQHPTDSRAMYEASQRFKKRLANAMVAQILQETG